MMWVLVLCALLPAATATSWIPHPPPTSKCALIICQAGFFCKEFTDPHTGVTQAVCIAGSPKPGRCPRPHYGQAGICASNCRHDGDCAGNHKCCRNSCGAFTCQKPVQDPVCNLPCPPGQKCILKPVVCCCPPCNPLPTCVPIFPPHGTCPAFPPYLNRFCYHHNRCHPNNPYSCESGDICCPTPCGYRCVSSPWD